MEYKLVKMTWCNQYAVLSRTPGAGWIYVDKYMDKTAAEKLYKELTTVL